MKNQVDAKKVAEILGYEKVNGKYYCGLYLQMLDCSLDANEGDEVYLSEGVYLDNKGYSLQEILKKHEHNLEDILKTYEE